MQYSEMHGVRRVNNAKFKTQTEHLRLKQNKLYFNGSESNEEQGIIIVCYTFTLNSVTMCRWNILLKSMFW